MAKVVILIQMLPTFGGRCNRFFWDIWLKILRLPIFNMLFQSAYKIFQKWTVQLRLPKVDHVIKSCKEPTVSHDIFVGVKSPALIIFSILLSTCNRNTYFRAINQYFVVSEWKRQVLIEQTLFLSTVFLCSEFKLENIYSGVNFGGKIFAVVFICESLLLFADRWKKPRKLQK